jgi:tRNA G18 (ribose-2'-O)-methylase SpoU
VAALRRDPGEKPASQDRPNLATPIPVNDPDDPRLAPFRAIRERDLVGREGRFIAEGEVVVRMLLTAMEFAVESVLVSARVAEAGREWFWPIPEGALFAVDDDVMEAVAGFHVHRGILAYGRRNPAPDMSTMLAGLPERATVVVCVGIANHDNMGGIFRNAAAFGAAAVLCDTTCCDPFYRKAIRVSVGGVFRVPFLRGGGAGELVAALQSLGFECLALSPSGGEELTAVAPAPRTALVLGAEGPGLPPSVLNRSRGIRIGMAGDFDSLNVAVSSGIALHRLMHQ